MGVSLGQLAANSASVAVKYGGATVNVDYFPSNVTENALGVMGKLQNAQNDEQAMMEGFRVFNETLVSLIKDWDLYEDDAQTQKVEISPVRFQTLPLAFRGAVLGAILGDIRPEVLTAQVTRNS